MQTNYKYQLNFNLIYGLLPVKRVVRQNWTLTEGRADVEKLTSGMVTDTLLIGRVADLSVYVCRADYTHKAEYTLINELAIEKKLSKLCTVINGVDLKKRKYGYYYGYGKYGKYYGYGKRYGYSYGYGEK